MIFKQNHLSSLKDIFIIFNNIKNEIDSPLEKVTKLSISFIDDNENCFNFLKYYIEKIIDLIRDEMTYYIKPELMKNYYEMINNQFLKGKVNYIILKELYYKCIQINDNDKNEDGKIIMKKLAYKYYKKYGKIFN